MAHGEVKPDPYSNPESAFNSTPGPDNGGQTHPIQPLPRDRELVQAEPPGLRGAAPSPPLHGGGAEMVPRPRKPRRSSPLRTSGERAAAGRRHRSASIDHRLAWIRVGTETCRKNRSPAGDIARRGAGCFQWAFWPWKFGVTADTVSICDVLKVGAGVFDTSNMTRWSHFLDDFLLLSRGEPRKR